MQNIKYSNEHIILRLLYKIAQKYSYNRIFDSYNNSNIINKLVIIFNKSPNIYLTDVNMQLDKQYKTLDVLSNYTKFIYTNYVGVRISKKDAKLQEQSVTNQATTTATATTTVGYVDINLLLLGLIYKRVNVENKYKLAELLYNSNNLYLYKAIDVDNNKISLDNVLFGIEGFDNDNDSIMWIYIILVIFLIMVIFLIYESNKTKL